jgi:hypothetical protein
MSRQCGRNGPWNDFGVETKSDIVGGWLLIVAYVALCVLAVTLSGCASPKKEIEKAATYATIEAGSAITALDSATATGEVGPKAAPFVADAKAHMGNVLGAASSITSNLPGVKDVEGWWVAWIKTGVIGAVCAVAFYFLWPVLPGVIAWIIVKFPKMLWMIPRTIRDTAKFDAEAMETISPTSTMHESVAIKRNRSPLYSAAFKLAKGQQ